MIAAGWFQWRVTRTIAEMDRDFEQVAGRRESRVPCWLEPALVKAAGIVTEPPRESGPPRGSLAEYFRAGRSVTLSVRLRELAGPAGSSDAAWRVRVILPADEARELAGSIRVGDFVSFSGHLTRDGPALNPGEYDRRMLGAQDGSIGTIRVPDAELIEVDRARADTWRAATWRAVGLARARAAQSLDAILGADPSGEPPSPGGTPGPGITPATAGRALIAAMLLGEREPGYDEADRAFRRLGLVHLVAISGFNLAILAGLALFLTRLLGDLGRLEPLIAGAIVASYMLVAPAEAPILRSGITLLVFLVTEAIGRRYDRLTLLGWTAAGLLLWRPMDLWSLGFQLSFGIVAVLLWLAESTKGRLFGVELRGVLEPRRSGWLWGLRDAARFGMDHLRTLIATSLLAWCVAMPIVAHHTGVISPLAVLTTLLVLPLTVFVLWAGYVALLAGVIWPGAGAALGSLLTPLGELLARVVMRLDDLPGMTIGVPRVSAAWAIVATACVVAWFRWWRAAHWAAWGATLVMIAWLAAEIWSGARLPRGVVVRLDTLAVGDATCHIVRSGDEAMLWDAGASNPAFGIVSLPRIARELGVGRIRTAVVTHANLDHFGALADAAESLGIERMLVCQSFLDAATARRDGAPAKLVRMLRAHGIDVEAVGDGFTLPLGKSTLSILSPPRAPGAVFESVNDSSLVGLVRPDDTDRGGILLCGDIGPGAIRGLRDRYPGLNAAVLELPHHGSFNHESAALVHASGASHVVQSTGRQRAVDPRWDDAKRGRSWRCTALDGCSSLILGRDGTWTEAGWVRTPLDARALNPHTTAR